MSCIGLSGRAPAAGSCDPTDCSPELSGVFRYGVALVPIVKVADSSPEAGYVSMMGPRSVSLEPLLRGTTPDCQAVQTPWRPAEFLERRGEYLACTLCPHGCELAVGDLGRCKVRRRTGDLIETATFTTAVEHLTPVERKPLYHYRPGRQVLTLAAPGCSFSCRCCQNHRRSQYGRSPDAIPHPPVSADPELMVNRAAAAGAAIGLSYSEPSLAPELPNPILADRGPGCRFVAAGSRDRVAPHGEGYRLSSSNPSSLHRTRKLSKFELGLISRYPVGAPGSMYPLRRG